MVFGKMSMATITFSTLPAEIHVSIAIHCENNDLINLCITSKWVNEIYVRVLYRHVDLLRLERGDLGVRHGLVYQQIADGRKRRRQFIRTLLSHPDYGKHVRYLKGNLSSFNDCHGLGEDRISDEELWRAMHSLTHIQSVDIGSILEFAYRSEVPQKQYPNDWFQSATSVRLVSHMQYGLAKSILNAINPAMLKRLCLDMVRDYKMGQIQNKHVRGGRGEDGRVRALGATSGLLTNVTGRFTALRTLILRREGQLEDVQSWHAAADEASYLEWALFIRSVQGTVEKFRFEHGGESLRDKLFIDSDARPWTIMDERFRRFILPAIIAGNWPCLTVIQLRGVRGWHEQSDTEPALATKLRAVLGRNVKIVVEGKVLVEEALILDDVEGPDLWD